MTPRFTTVARLAIFAMVLLLAFPASLAESCCCSSHATPQRSASGSADGPAKTESCCTKKAPGTTTVSAVASDSCGCDSMRAPGGAPATEIVLSAVGPAQNGFDQSAPEALTAQILANLEDDPRAGWSTTHSSVGLTLAGSASGPAPTRGPPVQRS